MLLLALGSIGAFLEIFVPQQLAQLSKAESSEMQLARQGTGSVNTSVVALWNDLSKGTLTLSSDQLANDLTIARQTVKSAADASAHVQAAQAYMAQADGLPFQLHSPAFIAADRPAAANLQKALNNANRLASAAQLQISIAQSMSQNLQGLTALNNSIAAGDWAGGARTAATLASNVKLQHDPAANPDTLLDPLWTKWIDDMATVVIDAQQYCLAAAQNQGPLAQQDAAAMAVARSRMAADYSAAQSHAAAWQQQVIQPLLTSVLQQAAGAGS